MTIFDDVLNSIDEDDQSLDKNDHSLKLKKRAEQINKTTDLELKKAGVRLAPTLPELSKAMGDVQDGYMSIPSYKDSSIANFLGKYRFLRNDYPATVAMDGKVYPSVEHAYQASKTDDVDIREEIRNSDIKKARQIGRNIDLPSDWDDIRLPIMKNLLYEKFKNIALRNYLIDTGTKILIMGSENDRYWGAVFENGVWKGENVLGKILMSVREFFMNDGSSYDEADIINLMYDNIKKIKDIFNLPQSRMSLEDLINQANLTHEENKTILDSLNNLGNLYNEINKHVKYNKSYGR